MCQSILKAIIEMPYQKLCLCAYTVQCRSGTKLNIEYDLNFGCANSTKTGKTNKHSATMTYSVMRIN